MMTDTTSAELLDELPADTRRDPLVDGAPTEATEDDFIGKKRTEKRIAVVFAEGQAPKLVKIRKLSRPESDVIRNAHPATPKQAREGAQVNYDTYPPAFMAEAVVAPKLTVEKWTEVWESKEWGSGELVSFFNEVENYSGESLDLTPFD